MQDKKTMSECAFSVSQIGELAKEVSEDTQNNYGYISWRSIKSLPVLKGQIEEIIEAQVEAFDILDNEDSEELE